MGRSQAMLISVLPFITTYLPPIDQRGGSFLLNYFNEGKSASAYILLTLNPPTHLHSLVNEVPQPQRVDIFSEGASFQGQG